jgi:hypothetical protein
MVPWPIDDTPSTRPALAADPTLARNADCIIAIEPLRAPGYASPNTTTARCELAAPLMEAPNRKDSGADSHSKGNDLELDPNREPEPPTKVIDKPVQRTGKRNPAAEGPAKDAPRPAAAAARGGRTDAGTCYSLGGCMGERMEKSISRKKQRMDLLCGREWMLVKNGRAMY